MAYAKVNPKKINYASGNTTGSVSAALFAKHNGLDMQHIPYKSEPPAINELVTGQTQLMFASYATSGPQVKDGKLRALSTTLPSRSSLLPDVPSITEAGQPVFPVGPWAGLVGPANLPPEIVERLNKETVAILKRADMQEQFARQGFAPRPTTPAEFKAFLADQMVIWKDALKTAGIEAQ